MENAKITMRLFWLFSTIVEYDDFRVYQNESRKYKQGNCSHHSHFYCSHFTRTFGRFFPFWINSSSSKNDTKQKSFGTRLPKPKKGGCTRGFIEAINVCVREKGSRHTKYHVIESYRVLELKREWKMFATKKVMKQRKSQGFLLLSGNSSNPFGNSRKKRIRDNYLQYLRRVHLLAKRFSSKRMAKNQVQNSSNPKEKNWGKWEVSEVRRTECAKLNLSKPNLT